MTPEPNPYAPPPEPSSPAAIAAGARPHDALANKRVRLGGALLLTNGLVGFFAPFVAARQGVSPPNFLALGVDALIGGALLAGFAKWRRVALVRVGLGVLFFAVYGALTSTLVEMLPRELINGGLLMLLVGAASRVRTRAGAALFAVGMLLHCLYFAGRFG